MYLFFTLVFIHFLTCNIVFTLANLFANSLANSIFFFLAGQLNNNLTLTQAL